MNSYYVYIITNKKNGTLYIGFTDDIHRRIYEHKNKLSDGFSKKYGLDKLVYFEEHENSSSSFKKERQMKKWRRAWKIKLIEEQNPNWKDLAEDWY
jgi:putative endonuclease